MDIFSIFTLCGGFALFLFGMKTLSTSLAKLAGGKLESTLKRLTSRPLSGLALGMGITMAIQSSSAVTVMLVGLVNSGILGLSESIGVIMGSNIGTTMTAWILSLAGIQSDNIFVRLLKPETLSPLVAFAGILLLMISKKQKHKDVGEIMLGFAVLMFGMQLMSSAVSPLRDSESFHSILIMFKNPLVGVAVGAVFTAIIQSSSASVGVLQALSLTGSITYGMAIPIVMGQNIGTCVTALFSSIGTNKNAKRVAAVHVFFNLIGTVLGLGVYYLLTSTIGGWLNYTDVTPLGIAVSHTIFNVFTTLVLFPFRGLLEKLANAVVKGKKPDADEVALIDERLFLTPAFAVAECKNLCAEMSKLACETLFASIDQLDNYIDERAANISMNEDMLDRYEDKLGGYLVNLSTKELAEKDSKQIARLLNSIGEFERVGDHAVNLLDAAAEMKEKNVAFSQSASQELGVLIDATVEILTVTNRAFESDDRELAKRVEPLEQIIDALVVEIKTRHINRLIKGECTVELGFILNDILGNFERVSDHCSNVAVYIIQEGSHELDTHTYLSDIKSGGEEFAKMFAKYREKYSLPQ